ncbi:MAG: S8 family peptidase [Clostridia bacterium]
MRVKIDDFKVVEVKASQKKEIVDYGVRMVGAPLEWRETTGKGIKVGIIDTGIDLNHEDLQDRVKEYINFTSRDKKDVTDENGHGTHVAGVVAANRNNVGVVGVAPEADLYIAKAFDKEGNADTSAVFNSLTWMAERNVDVINMSFSSQTTTREYQRVISYLDNSGITLVCAAGNEGISESGSGDTIGYPAKFDETIAVTAVDMNKKRTDFSSVGTAAEVAAAGKDIFSCYKDNTYATLSGTSMATPIITGAVALLQAQGIKKHGRRLTPEEIRILLHVYSEDLGEPGRDSEYGYGLFSFGRINESDYISDMNYNRERVRSNGNYPYSRSAIMRKQLFRTNNTVLGMALIKFLFL